MWPFGKNKSQNSDDLYKTALRQLDAGTTTLRPSWVGNHSKEKSFYEGIMAIIKQGSTPIDYAVRGFISPQSSEVMYSFAASIELQGASFSEQQAATAKFINQMWAELLPHDKEYFSKNKLGFL